MNRRTNSHNLHTARTGNVLAHFVHFYIGLFVIDLYTQYVQHKALAKTQKHKQTQKDANTKLYTLASGRGNHNNVQ